ncbi:MAG TPA: hypothetical protein VES20_08755, partial [Bryobacteraceae bacterium]|nr:hypothetical protein [Bryobacteraceae bacterium]
STEWLAAPGTVPLISRILFLGSGALLLVGLWTPIAGTLVAITALWNSFQAAREPWGLVLLGAVGIGLAMVGPGALSIDARLFGRKRIDLRRYE